MLFTKQFAFPVLGFSLDFEGGRKLTHTVMPRAGTSRPLAGVSGRDRGVQGP
jgi:hypothetical protein